MSRPRFGYRRLLVMLRREGWEGGKKRVYRLYSLEGLQLRMKVKRRKRIALLRGKPPVPTGPNQHWIGLRPFADGTNPSPWIMGMGPSLPPAPCTTGPIATA